MDVKVGEMQKRSDTRGLGLSVRLKTGCLVLLGPVLCLAWLGRGI